MSTPDPCKDATRDGRGVGTHVQSMGECCAVCVPLLLVCSCCVCARPDIVREPPVERFGGSVLSSALLCWVMVV